MVTLTAKHEAVRFRMNSCALRAFEEERWVRELYWGRVPLRESSPVRFITYNSSHFFPCCNLVRFLSWVLARGKQLGPSVPQGSKLCCTGEHHLCKGTQIFTFLLACVDFWGNMLRSDPCHCSGLQCQSWSQTSKLAVAWRCAVPGDCDRISSQFTLWLIKPSLVERICPTYTLWKAFSPPLPSPQELEIPKASPAFCKNVPHTRWRAGKASGFWCFLFCLISVALPNMIIVVNLSNIFFTGYVSLYLCKHLLYLQGWTLGIPTFYLSHL